MPKYLYVEFANTYATYEEMQMGFCATTTTANRRIKKIRLTAEQVKELEPEQVYRNGDYMLYEKVSVLCVQEDPEVT